jgi:hypothetical protein
VADRKTLAEVLAEARAEFASWPAEMRAWYLRCREMRREMDETKGEAI